jgi:cytochrome c oxidase subunit 2
VKDANYYFKINTEDVLHSFWVPEFRMKKDAVPGMTTTVRVTPTRRGRYAVVCAELCGLGHSTMRAVVKVENQASFDKWAAGVRRSQGEVGSEPAGGGP